MTGIHFVAIFLAAFTFAICGCDKDTSQQGQTGSASNFHHGHNHADDEHDIDGSGAGPEKAIHGHDDNSLGHDHDHEGPSDLDRSIHDLLQMDCEHGIKAFMCDECRYETGFVTVGQELFDKGLLKTVRTMLTARESGMVLSGETRLSESRIARVGPRTPGQVASVKVQPGDLVRKGQTLFEIESAAFPDAAGDWLAAEAAFKLAESSARRHQDLHQRGLNSIREYQEAMSEASAARIRLDSAAVRLKASGMTQADARTLSSGGNNRIAIRAPIDGEVFIVNATRGMFIEPGQETVVLGERGVLEVMVDLRENDLQAIASAFKPDGIPTSVTVAAWPGQIFPGTIDLIEPMMSRQTRTVRARITVTNDELLLRPGMFATASPQINHDAVAIMLPAEAVLADEGRTFVFVHHEGPLFMRRPVDIGRATNTTVEITSGLVPGQTVVTRGAFLLKSEVLKEKMGEGCAH